MPRPLISQFISGVMDGSDLTVGKHWSGKLCYAICKMISGATSGVVGTAFARRRVEILMASFCMRSD